LSKDSSDESCCEVASTQRKRQWTLEANSEAKGRHGGQAAHQAGTEEPLSGEAETGETPDIDVEVLPEDRTARPDGCSASPAGFWEVLRAIPLCKFKGVQSISLCWTAEVIRTVALAKLRIRRTIDCFIAPTHMQLEGGRQGMDLSF
jgi:hypothetical protein